MRRSLIRGFLLLSLAVATAWFLRPAEGHGTLDQSLEFDPGCLASTLRATAPSSGALRQEVVPGPEATGLQSMDVCLTMASTVNVVLSVRSGTAAAPGAILATKSATGVMSGTRWVHFELNALLPTTPGTKIVLELTGFPLFSWRGTCGQVAGACTTIDPDLYTPGVSSAVPGVSDFAFRTYASVDTDGDTLADPVDNCTNDPNLGQENADANFIDQTPPRNADDITWINSDELGDACDDDDDNDGLSDDDETDGPPCASASAATDPLLRDTDGDRRLDEAECLLGTNPTSSASFPPNIVSPDADSDGVPDPLDPNDADLDSDDDGLRDGIEFRNYHSNMVGVDSDADTCNDGHEVATVNGDLAVSSADLVFVAASFGFAGEPQYVVNIDTNKDGVISSADLAFVAGQFGFCP